MKPHSTNRIANIRQHQKQKRPRPIRFQFARNNLIIEFKIGLYSESHRKGGKHQIGYLINIFHAFSEVPFYFLQNSDRKSDLDLRYLPACLPACLPNKIIILFNFHCTTTYKIKIKIEKPTK